jgi:hypothetical protein
VLAANARFTTIWKRDTSARSKLPRRRPPL